MGFNGMRGRWEVFPSKNYNCNYDYIERPLRTFSYKKSKVLEEKSAKNYSRQKIFGFNCLTSVNSQKRTRVASSSFFSNNPV